MMANVHGKVHFPWFFRFRASIQSPKSKVCLSYVQYVAKSINCDFRSCHFKNTPANCIFKDFYLFFYSSGIKDITEHGQAEFLVLFLSTRFFFKNELYKNTQTDICPKIKIKLRTTTRLKFSSDKFKPSFIYLLYTDWDLHVSS